MSMKPLNPQQAAVLDHFVTITVKIVGLGVG